MMESSDNLNVATIKLSDIMHYLISNGWQQVKYNDRRTLVFTKPDAHSEKPFVVTLPQSENFRDYSARIEETIDRLSIIEDTSFGTVTRKIRSVGQDVIYLRMVLNQEEYPSLENASHFIKGMRDLIAWGACMEREQQRYFSQPFNVGRAQAEHFQLAHTYQGSFGFAIESHIDESQQLPIWAGYANRPLARRVLERITRGFLFTQQAERRQDINEITESFARGFNSNMCKAAAEMLEDIRSGNLTYGVHWSVNLKASEDVAVFEPIVLSKESIYYLQDAAAYLEKIGRKDTQGERTIIGQVIGLGYDGHGEHEVIMMADGIGRVEFILDEKQYQIAGLAHLSTQTVQVRGNLIRQGRREKKFILTSPRDFHVNQ